MLATLRTHWTVAACFARLALQRQMEYPLFLFTWLISNPLQYIFGIWLLKTIVDRFHPLSGWNLPQLAFVYGLGLISHGLVVLLFVQSWSVDNMIGTGDFDR